MRRIKFLTMAAILGGTVLAGASTAGAQSKLWSVQLQTVGWKNPLDDLKFVPGHPLPYDPDLGVISPRELAVDAQGQVYVGFGMKNLQPGVPKSLRVVVFDGAHTAPIRQMDLPTPSLERTAVLLDGDGALIVIAGDRVQRFNPDGSAGASIALPPMPKINPALWVEQSPARHTLMLTTDEQNFRYVRSDTLATIAECANKDQSVETITDKLAIGLAEGADHQYGLHSGPLCGPSPLLWSLQSERSSDVHLLQDGTLLEVGADQVRRLTLADKSLWKWKAPEGMIPEGIQSTASSRSGERVAVELDGYRILHSVGCMECKGPQSESWAAAVVVLDSATGRQIGLVALDHAYANQLGFALSPDGHKLAVLSGGDLEVWQLE
jgi:hypothetical protein